MTPRPRGWPARRLTMLSILLAAVVAYHYAGLSWKQLIPRRAGTSIVAEFVSRAVTPAFEYESEFVPEDAPPLWLRSARCGPPYRRLCRRRLQLGSGVGHPVGMSGHHRVVVRSRLSPPPSGRNDPAPMRAARMGSDEGHDHRHAFGA